MTARARRVGLSFWLEWVAASLLGLAIGVGLLLALSKGIGGPPHKAIMGSVVGGTVGTLQWLVLRRVGTKSPWWVAAAIVAWGVGAPAELIGGLTLSIAVLALLAGVLQSLALRGAVARNLWWLPANVLAWSVFLGIVRLSNQLPSPALGLGLGFTFVSAITGLAMIWMQRVESIS